MCASRCDGAIQLRDRLRPRRVETTLTVAPILALPFALTVLGLGLLLSKGLTERRTRKLRDLVQADHELRVSRVAYGIVETKRHRILLLVFVPIAVFARPLEGGIVKWAALGVCVAGALLSVLLRERRVVATMSSGEILIYDVDLQLRRLKGAPAASSPGKVSVESGFSHFVLRTDDGADVSIWKWWQSDQIPPRNE